MALEYPIILNVIITYDDFAVLELEIGDEVMYFEISDRWTGELETRPLELVAHMFYDEYEDWDMDKILDAVDNYDLSGETDDCQMYMYFRYI